MVIDEVMDEKISMLSCFDFANKAVDYVRSTKGREAIERGLSDIKHGRVIAGADALASELKRRAANRRKVR